MTKTDEVDKKLTNVDVVSKDGREKCWKARDAFWQCLTENGEDKEKCKKERELFENNCSKTWVNSSFFYF